MSILFLSDKEANDKISIDELFEKKQKQDLKQLSIFNKILNRVHTKITKASARRIAEKNIWYVIPPYLVGQTLYKHADCIGYVIAKLTANGFYVKYMHPGIIFVSWDNFIPKYARVQLQKATGIEIDEKGIIIPVEVVEEPEIDAKAAKMAAARNKYTPITQYQPTGNLVYPSDIFEKTRNKLSNGAQSR